MFPILLQFSTNWFEKRPVWMALLLFTWVRSLTYLSVELAQRSTDY